MPYCPSLPNPTTTRGPRYLYLQKNFGFKCNFMHAYAADRLVENPCVKLAFCIMPLYNTKSASLKQLWLWSFLASFLYHVISVSIKPCHSSPFCIMMNFRLETSSFICLKTTIFEVDVYASLLIPSSLTTSHNGTICNEKSHSFGDLHTICP